MLGINQERLLKVAGSIIAVFVLGAMIFLLGVYGSINNQVAELEAKSLGYQEQASMLGSELEKVREDYLTTVTKLESLVDQARKDNTTQITELKVQAEQIWSTGIEPLEKRLVELGSRPTYGISIAYINAEDAFTVFTNAVQEQREKAFDKQEEIIALQRRYVESAISKEEYEDTYNLKQVELLQAQTNISMGTIDKLIISSSFSDVRGDLEQLREQAQPIVDEIESLASSVRVGIIESEEFSSRYTQARNAFTQLDELLTNLATSRIVEAANRIALANGYDLVLRAKNVIIYRNTARLTDITDMVKAELSRYLRF